MTGVLAGKTIAVTGAGRGLGRAYALECAREGASVVVNDLDPSTAAETTHEIVRAGGAAIACAGATDSPGFGDILVAGARDNFGGIDGLVANAGIISPKSLFDETFANAERTMSVNVLGVIESATAVAREMRSQNRGGSIVLITSGARAGVPGMPTYGASKGAVASLCWGWALDAAPSGIRINALSPVARTDMFPRPGDTTSDPFDPERIAPAAVYLLSDLASGITGQIVRFTGNLLALSPAPAITSVTLTRESWTAQEIAAAFRGELATGIAAVGSGQELAVPFQASISP